MDLQNYYTTLGLAPSAPPEVIRAAYEALTQIYSSDEIAPTPLKVLSYRAANFKQIREAYDTLSDPSARLAYDAELACSDNNWQNEDCTASNVDNQPQLVSDAPSVAKRTSAAELTTPGEKMSIRAGAAQQLERLREQRAAHDVEEVHLHVEELKHLSLIWQTLADEHEDDPPLRAQCTIRVHELEQKVLEREHKDWTVPEEISSSVVSVTPSQTLQHTTAHTHTPEAPTKRTAPSTSDTSTFTPHTSSISSTSSPYRNNRREERKRAEQQRAEASAARAQLRLQQKAQREAAKQAIVDQKAAAVRAEKESFKVRVEQKLRLDSERIAKARAKAARGRLPDVSLTAVSLGAADDGNGFAFDGPNVDREGVIGSTIITKGVCGKCGLEHATFGDWKKCNIESS
jgi:hypothetical protein